MLNNKKVVVIINNEFKGFLTAIGKILVDDYGSKVTFLAKNRDIKNIVKKIYVDKCEVEVRGYNKNIHYDDIIKKSLEIEKRYSVKMSELISSDRALGQGYLFNVGKIPHIWRSEWSHEKKLSEIISTIRTYENVLLNCDIMIQQNINPFTSMICKVKGIKMFSLAEIKSSHVKTLNFFSSK